MILDILVSCSLVLKVIKIHLLCLSPTQTDHCFLTLTLIQRAATIKTFAFVFSPFLTLLTLFIHLSVSNLKLRLEKMLLSVTYVPSFNPVEK